MMYRLEETSPYRGNWKQIGTTRKTLGLGNTPEYVSSSYMPERVFNWFGLNMHSLSDYLHKTNDMSYDTNLSPYRNWVKIIKGFSDSLLVEIRTKVFATRGIKL